MIYLRHLLTLMLVVAISMHGLAAAAACVNQQDARAGHGAGFEQSVERTQAGGSPYVRIPYAVSHVHGSSPAEQKSSTHAGCTCAKACCQPMSAQASAVAIPPEFQPPQGTPTPLQPLSWAESVPHKTAQSLSARTPGHAGTSHLLASTERLGRGACETFIASSWPARSLGPRP